MAMSLLQQNLEAAPDTEDQAAFEGRPPEQTSSSVAPVELVSAATDYLRKRYQTGGQNAARLGLDDAAFDTAGRDLADRIHQQASQQYEDLFTGKTTRDQMAAEQAQADAEFQKAKALNPTVPDDQIHAALDNDKQKLAERTKAVGDTLSSIMNFGPVRVTTEAIKQATDIGEGLFGVGLQKGLEGVSTLAGKPGNRGAEEAAVTSAVTAETDQIPEWLRPFATPFLYATGAGEAKRLAQENANLPSVQVGPVKLDVLTLAEMGLPVGGFAEGTARAPGILAKLANTGKVSTTDKAVLTAEQLLARTSRTANPAAEAARVVAGPSTLNARLDARAAALEAAGSPAAKSARQIASEAAANPGAATNEALAAANGKPFAPGTGATLEPGSSAAEVAAGAKTNPAAVAQIKATRANSLTGAIKEFATAQGGEGRIGSVTGADLVKAVVEKAKSIGKAMSPEDQALLERVGVKIDAGETLTKEEQVIADRLNAFKSGPTASHPGLETPEARAAQGRTSQPRPLEGGLKTSEFAGNDVGKLTKAIQTATAGRIISIKAFGDAVRSGKGLEGVPQELIDKFLRGEVEVALTKKGVDPAVIQGMMTKLGRVTPAAASEAAKSAGAGADVAAAAADAAKTAAGKSAGTLFGEPAPRGGQAAVAKGAAERAVQAEEGVGAGGISGGKAPPTAEASKQPPFGPERMPGDVQTPVQGALKTETTPYLNEAGKPVKINGKNVQQTSLAPSFGKGEAKVPHTPLGFPDEMIKAVYNEKTGAFDEAAAKALVDQLRLKYPNNAVSDTLEKATAWDQVTGALNLPRAIKASFDLSAPLRQGIILTVTHPIKAFGKDGAFRTMIRTLADSKVAEDVDKLIHQNDSIFEAMDLYIAALKDAALSGKEEALMTNYLMGNLNVFGKDVNLFRKSQYAYTTYLNKLRSDVAMDAYNAAKASKQGGFNAEEMKAVGAWINHATGRGDLGVLSKYGPTLNALFFSPRYTISRVQSVGDALLGTPDLAKAIAQHAGIETEFNRGRAMAAADMAKFTSAGLSLMALQKAAHLANIPGMGDVETDPRSTDFGKMKIGPSTVDMWGGFQQFARFAAQAATNERVPVTGKHEGEVINVGPSWLAGAFTTGGRFVESKLSPTASFVNGIKKAQEELSKTNSAFAKAAKEAEGADFWGQPIGVDYVGKIYTLKDALNPLSQTGLFTPMSWSDFAQAMQGENDLGPNGNPLRGAFVGTLSFFGAGVNTLPDQESTTPEGANEANPFLEAYK